MAKPVVHARCASCGLPYDRLSAGSHLCFSHVGEPDASGHYTCCSMSTNTRMCVRHAESRRETSRGCFPTDHSASLDERSALRTRPYSVCTIDQAVECMPHIATPNGSTVFHFADADSIRGEFTLDVPAQMGVVGNRIVIDLREEHDALYRDVNDVKKMEVATDPYAQEWDVANGVNCENAAAFLPFVLFMRIGSAPDDIRAREFAIALAGPCSN